MSRPTVMGLIGAVLDGRYRLLSLLGEGGMGAVYLAERTEDGASVAVKVLLEELGDHPETVQRFEREAKALFGLSHANILKVHDYGLVEGRPYLVMDRLDGASLDTFVEDGPLPPERALDIAEAVLDALAYAHDLGAVHRDLKTENVNVGADGHVTVLDFGLVKFTDDDRWGKGAKPSYRARLRAHCTAGCVCPATNPS
ncbi:MAG: serine/threonine-protein kinase, partial [Myxococcota bacterium]